MLAVSKHFFEISVATSNHHLIDAPSAWVVRFLPLIPKEGEVLDVACGSGRHARLLQAAGHRILTLDRDAAALAAVAATGISTLQIDLEAMTDNRPAWPFEDSRFAAIVVTNYLFRPLLPLLTASLVPGGVFLYETFGVGNEKFGKPSNPDFLLRPGELLETARNAATGPLQVVGYECGRIDFPRAAIVQRICAVRTAAASLDLPIN